jgi:hypothetical protein
MRSFFDVRAFLEFLEGEGTKEEDLGEKNADKYGVRILITNAEKEIQKKRVCNGYTLTYTSNNLYQVHTDI